MEQLRNEDFGRREVLYGDEARGSYIRTRVLTHFEARTVDLYVNANGRTGRLMSNFLLMRAGYEPVNIQAESRALHRGDQGVPGRR